MLMLAVELTCCDLLVGDDSMILNLSNTNLRALVPMCVKDFDIHILHTLVLSNNLVKSLNSVICAPLPALRYLDVSHNQLEEMVVRGRGGLPFSKLEHLDLSTTAYRVSVG